MVQFTNEEYADIIFCYGFSNGNSLEAEREYHRRFPERRQPSRGVFQRAFQRLRETGSVRTLSTQAEVNVAPISVEMEERILEATRADPTTSTRRIAYGVGVSASTVWRVLRREGLYPFHVTPVQELQPQDKISRREFCNWLLEKDFDDCTFLDNILWTDESQFTKCGIVNLHNTHYWTSENPRIARQTSSQYRFSVNLWAGIVGNRLIPHILPDRLNSDNYLNFLQNDLIDLMDDIPLATRRDILYQHDGAPAHCGRNVLQWLNGNYRDRWIERRGSFPWPARSPDLTPLDFYLWGTMKEMVYGSEVATRDELITRILEAGNKIKENLATIDLKRSMRKRALLCIQNDGGHFENILTNSFDFLFSALLNTQSFSGLPNFNTKSKKINNLGGRKKIS